MELNEEDVKWNPDTATFNKYLDREMENARQNISLFLKSCKKPMHVRSLLESTLHSPEMVMRALSLELRAGNIKRKSDFLSVAS